jgi:hypothetical protein
LRRAHSAISCPLPRVLVAPRPSVMAGVATPGVVLPGGGAWVEAPGKAAAGTLLVRARSPNSALRPTPETISQSAWPSASRRKPVSTRSGPPVSTAMPSVWRSGRSGRARLCPQNRAKPAISTSAGAAGSHHSRLTAAAATSAARCIAPWPSR